MSFLRVILGLVAALCVNAAQSAWEESTAVPVRLDSHGTEPTHSAEAREKESEKRIYRLDVFGKRMVLVLEPDQTFLAPGFVFQMVGKPESEEFDSAGQARCFFSGSVNGEELSAAAINLCNGLRGGFYVGGEEYFIQPANTSGQASDGDVHVIRRRKRGLLAEENGSKCGVNEEEERVSEKPFATKSDTEPSESKGKYCIIKLIFLSILYRVHTFIRLESAMIFR